MSVPCFIAIGRGVLMRKLSSGGVIACRFSALEKKSKTRSRGSGRSVLSK